MCCEHALTLGGRMVLCGEADVRRGNCPVADMIVVVIIKSPASAAAAASLSLEIDMR